MNTQITMYGSNWCGYTQRAMRHLDGLGVAYTYVDVDENPDAEELIASWNDGRAIRPTFDIGGQHFVNPPMQKLEELLRANELLK